MTSAPREMPVADSDAADDSKHRFGLVRVDTILQDVPPPDWLIPGFLERVTTATCIGPPAHGKSAHAIDWCCRMATGTAWHGHPVKQSPAVYVCGEGRNGIARRLQAWQAFNDIPLTGAPFAISTQAAHLTVEMQAYEVHKAIVETFDDSPGLIVVDTLARNFGANENSTEDMQRFIDHVDYYLRDAFQACVLIVHHTGHAAGDRGRGSSALFAGVDTEYHIKKDPGGLVTLHCTKMKDHTEPRDELMRLKGIEVPGHDHYGNPITAPVLEPLDGPVSAALTRPLGKNQQTALEIVLDLNDLALEKAGAGEPVRVSIAEWRQKCSAAGLDRRRWTEASNGLQSLGKIRMEGGHVYVTE
ncbi:AAA family ATPase [Elongatibacter sediminis]|uniref:AAA family ATPase n=1 Tax=Elongatibacter sediminis TaxID=3119006 RepID=A0AAW9RES4_9GAMM